VEVSTLGLYSINLCKVDLSQLLNVTALAATYATGTVRVLYRPWAKATLCHLTTYCVYSSLFPPLPSSSFLSFRSSHIAQLYEFR